MVVVCASYFLNKLGLHYYATYYWVLYNEIVFMRPCLRAGSIWTRPSDAQSLRSSSAKCPLLYVIYPSPSSRLPLPVNSPSTFLPANPYASPYSNPSLSIFRIYPDPPSSICASGLPIVLLNSPPFLCDISFGCRLSFWLSVSLRLTLS